MWTGSDRRFRNGNEVGGCGLLDDGLMQPRDPEGVLADGAGQHVERGGRIRGIELGIARNPLMKPEGRIGLFVELRRGSCANGVASRTREDPELLACMGGTGEIEKPLGFDEAAGDVGRIEAKGRRRAGGHGLVDVPDLDAVFLANGKELQEDLMRAAVGAFRQIGRRRRIAESPTGLGKGDGERAKASKPAQHESITAGEREEMGGVRCAH